MELLISSGVASITIESDVSNTVVPSAAASSTVWMAERVVAEVPTTLLLANGH